MSTLSFNLLHFLTTKKGAVFCRAVETFFDFFIYSHRFKLDYAYPIWQFCKILYHLEKPSCRCH